MSKHPASGNNRRGEPRSPAEKLCFSDFSKENNRMFRLKATDFAWAKSAGDQGSPLRVLYDILFAIYPSNHLTNGSSGAKLNVIFEKEVRPCTPCSLFGICLCPFAVMFTGPGLHRRTLTHKNIQEFDGSAGFCPHCRFFILKEGFGNGTQTERILRKL